MTHHLKQKVVSEFSNPSVQESYKDMTRRGLWASEEVLIEEYFEPGSRVLDVGCGSGRTTFPLIKRGYDVIGVDLTPAMIDSAKEMGKEFDLSCDFRVGDATALDFTNASFDCALFSFNGLCMIPGKEQRLKAMKELFRVLRPGGTLMFTSLLRRFGTYAPFWSLRWLEFYIAKKVGFAVRAQEFGDIFFKYGSEEEYENDQFLHIADKKEILGLIEDSGFHLVYSNYRNTIDPKDKDLGSGNCVFFVCEKPL